MTECIGLCVLVQHRRNNSIIEQTSQPIHRPSVCLLHAQSARSTVTQHEKPQDTYTLNTYGLRLRTEQEFADDNDILFLHYNEKYF